MRKASKFDGPSRQTRLSIGPIWAKFHVFDAHRLGGLHCQYEKSHCKVDDCYDYECQSDRNGGVSGEPSPIHRSFLMPLKMDAGPCRLPIWCGNRFPSSKGSGERWIPELKLTAASSRVHIAT